jgi:hypothetical protein
VIVRRWFRVRPVAEVAALAGYPVDAAAAPRTFENERHQGRGGWIRGDRSCWSWAVLVAGVAPELPPDPRLTGWEQDVDLAIRAQASDRLAVLARAALSRVEARATQGVLQCGRAKPQHTAFAIETPHSRSEHDLSSLCDCRPRRQGAQRKRSVG